MSTAEVFGPSEYVYDVVPHPTEPGEFVSMWEDGSYSSWIPSADSAARRRSTTLAKVSTVITA
jgi:hypothetical protein